LLAAAAGADEPFREALVLAPAGRAGREPVRADAVEAAIVAGTWREPKADETVALPDGGTRKWTRIEAGKDGWLRHEALRGGWACIAFDAPEAGVRLLHARAHGMVYVNGEPRAGDPYDSGRFRLPVAVRAGRNVLLFSCGRGQLQAALTAPPSSVFLDAADATLPDLVAGEGVVVAAAVVVVNATAERQEGLRLVAACADGSRATELPPVPPLSARKVPFEIDGRGATGDRAEARLTLERGGAALHQASVPLRVRRPAELHRRTLRSAIDDTVQYYAVLPATRTEPPPALVLTLHGAGVEAQGQAEAYAAKSWAHVVAPTNRRPFGFDWEDWGRLDALEVLDDAGRRLAHDPARVCLTGHSMGGHGTWQLGVHFPDRFAALGPSAGWASFRTYQGGGRRPFGPDTAVVSLVRRAEAESDTPALLGNLSALGVYVLHGDADDNVPVREARRLKEQLAGHRDLTVHEQPGAGHWWDASDEPGTDCVDWSPMFELFARRARPPLDAVREVAFTTVNPAVSSRCHWVEIEAQRRSLEPSRVQLRLDPLARRFRGTTENVARLALRVDQLAPGKVRVELDGGKLEIAKGSGPAAGPDPLRLERREDAWVVAGPPDPALKGSHRSGPFKLAFQNRARLVYGTGGSGEERAWAFAKARYDAETIWVRGNGAFDVVADTAFDAAAEPDRSVVLYGNAKTNRAWRALVDDAELPAVGEGCGALIVRPRRGSARALVGIVTGADARGMRLTDRLPYFTSGVHYPDWIVLGPETLERGLAGVRAAGFYGPDWRMETGERATRE
jgi:dienelactone hydrolase